MADGSVKIEIVADSSQAEEAIKRTGAAVEDLGDAAEKASGETSELGDSADGAAGGVGELDESGLSAKASMLALTAALSGTAKAMQEVAQWAVNASTQFESAFAKTTTIMDQTAVSTEDMRAAILDLSTATGMAATDVAEAVYQAISGSIDTADAISFVNQANMLAVAGFTSLTNATDVLTTAINAYGLSASATAGISNVLIQTQNMGKTSVDELANSMGRAIATASAFGVNLENVAASYVEITRNGIATAEATTYLSSMLNELGDVGSTVGKILQEVTGETFAQLMADGYSLGDIMQILSDSVNGSADAFMNLWSSQEAGKAANAIMTQGIEDFNAVVAQMSREMEGATNTTQAAYETMTATSEFINARFQTALTNLGIAVGDQLTPVLNGVKTALTGLVEGMTGIVNSGPRAVAVFAALTTAVTLLAAASAICAAHVWLTQTAVGALIGAMVTNPIFMALAAILALGVGVATFVSNLETGTAELREFEDGLSGITQTKDQTIASIQATADAVDYYVDQLEALEAAGLDSAEAQAEYHAILEQLVSLVPDLASVIDLETDSINGGTAAIRANTAAWQENAQARAMQQYMTSFYDAQTQAVIENAKATVRYNDAAERRRALETEEIAIQSRLDEIHNKMFGDTELTTEEIRSLNKESDELRARLLQVSTALSEADGEMNKAAAAMDVAAGKVRMANDAVAEAEQVYREAMSALQDGGNATQGFGDAFEDSGAKTAAASTAISSAISGISGNLAELQGAYESAYAAAMESISGQFNLWDQIAPTVGTSMEEINAALQSQIDYWHNYNDNADYLMRSGIDGMKEFVQQYGDGSIEMASYFQTMVDALKAGDTEAVQTTMSLIQQLYSVHDEAGRAMALAASQFSQSCEIIRSMMHVLIEGLDMSDEAKSAAKAVVDGYISGVASGDLDAEAAGQMLATAAQNGLLGDMATAMAAGAGLTEAFVAAIKAGAGHAYAAAAEVAAAASNGFHSAGGARLYNKEQAYASGTRYAATGYALVGEEGPELVYLRGGERILSADETRSVLQSTYSVDRNLYDGSAAAAGGFNGSARMQATIEVPVSIDGREVARATAEYMGEEMEWEVL